MSPRLPRFGRSRRDDADGPAAPVPVDVPIRDEVIRLGQFLKLANLIDTGAEAKVVLAEGLVQVNGEPEARRGRQLRRGDVVELNGQAARVADEASADDLPW
ncbi:RNA-binding S4 domain-containing protein [Nocardioides sp.]|uniref:RNA-binding S4 domain-containing protein n=1 Tax=Nocardioides sp. TaxID=35761 RepID=UPI003517F852